MVLDNSLGDACNGSEYSTPILHPGSILTFWPRMILAFVLLILYCIKFPSVCQTISKPDKSPHCYTLQPRLGEGEIYHSEKSLPDEGKLPRPVRAGTRLAVSAFLWEENSERRRISSRITTGSS